MAQTKAFNFDMPERTISVGHNRTVERQGRKIRCMLHGNCIVTIQEPKANSALVILDDCGWPGTTTRNAMKDFIRAYGGTLGVSFAKGGFAICFKDASGERRDIDDYCGQAFEIEVN